MEKKDRIKILRLIWESIRRNKDYQKCYSHFIEADRKGNAVLSSKYLLKIAKQWEIFDPIDPSREASKIPVYKLEMFFKKGAVLLDMETHRQLANKAKVPPIVKLSVDIRRNKTQIYREVMEVIKKMQLVYQNQGGKRVDLPDDKKDIWNYSIKDFSIYDKCIKLKKDTGRIPFHKIARRLLGEDALSTDVDLEAKKMRNAYERVGWLIEGGYRILMQKL